ncbi:MAG: hypothetical protein AAGC55_21525 [Myxococcota bacterium]
MGHPFRIGGVLAKTLAIWWRNKVFFTAIRALTLLPFLLVVALFFEGGDLLVSTANELRSSGFESLFIVTTVALLFATEVPLAIHTVAQLRGQSPSAGQSLRDSLPHILPSLGIAALFSGIYVLLAIAATLLFAISERLSVAAFVIGCTSIWLALCVTLPARALEGDGVFASFERSRALTAGHRGAILGILLVLGLLMGALYSLAVILLYYLAEALARFGIGPTPITSLIALVAVLALALWTTGLAVLYRDLRLSREGNSAA